MGHDIDVVSKLSAFQCDTLTWDPGGVCFEHRLFDPTAKTDQLRPAIQDVDMNGDKLYVP